MNASMDQIPSATPTSAEVAKSIAAQAAALHAGTTTTLEFEAFVLRQIALLAHQTAPAVVEASRADELLDFMAEHRIAVVPEFEGGWDAEVYGEDATVVAYFSGASPREALERAMENKKAADQGRCKAWG